MRSHRQWLPALLLLVIALAAPCLAQNPSGPATLENLLNSAEFTDTPAATDQQTSGPGSRRPPGAVARPKDGVRHPDLDKAWAYYEVAVGKANEAVRHWMSKQFDEAASRGDLDEAERWQDAVERFEQSGELPNTNDARVVVGRAVADYKKARDELSRSYEAVVKALTMEKKIEEARALRDEQISLEKKTAGLGTHDKQSSTSRNEVAIQSKARVDNAKEVVAAKFVGTWIDERWNIITEIRADGRFVVKNDPSNEWSGTWSLDLTDPEKPSLIRKTNNGRVLRINMHPTRAGALISGGDTYRRK